MAESISFDKSGYLNFYHPIDSHFHKFFDSKRSVSIEFLLKF